MARLTRSAVYLAPVAVVLVLGEIHAHLIGHYPFADTFRFGWMLAYVATLWVSGYAVGLPDTPRTVGSAVVSSAVAVAAGAGVISLAQLLSGSLLLPRFVVLGGAGLLIPAYTWLTLGSERLRRRREGSDRVLAVVCAEEAAALAHDLARAPERPASLVAALPAAEAARPALSLAPAAGGELRPPPAVPPLVEQAQAVGATVIVLDRQAQADETVVAQAALLHGQGVRVRTLSLFTDEWLGKLPVSELEQMSLMFDIQELHAQRYARLKRFVDLAVGLAGLVALAAAVPVVWLLDRVGNPGPLFYRQPRVGQGGALFDIVKFRSMPPGSAGSPWTGDDDPRLSPVGRWMRRVHLDELPQVLNIVRGELSLVGPRPEQPCYVEQLRAEIPFYDVRHLVHPGLTGWAQVKYQYGASVADALQKLQYEFYYLRHQSLALDLRIVARTIRSVVHRQGR